MAHHLIQVSLHIALFQVDLLICLDDVLQPLLPFLALLKLQSCREERHIYQGSKEGAPQQLSIDKITSQV